MSYANAPILLKAGTYTISANGFSATGGAQGYLSFGARYSDETLVQSSSIRNNSATITLEEDAHCYYWIYVANNRTINEDIAIQVEAGSTATSWTPYENICPIEGWNEVKVARAGKNITNIAVLPYTIHWGTDAADLVQFLNTLPVGRYTISNKFKINEVPSSGKVLHGAFLIRALVNGEQINVTPYLLVTDNNPAVGKVYQESVSFEITEAIKGNINHAYRYCDQDNPHSGSGRGSYDCYDVQIETGSVATDYEPYAGTEVTVQFGQTVYKGVLDAKNSKVIATHAYATINPSTISKIGTWDGTKGAFWWTVSISGDWDNSSVNNGVSCDSFEMKPNISQVHTENGMCWNMQKIVRWLDVPTMSMTLEEYQTYVSTHPINCLYKLATPIEIPLSAISQLETLLGVNNVYANTGDVDLKYLKQV